MFWFIPRIVSFREAIGIKKKPDWIVCGIIPDTILIINSHPLSSVVHFPLVSFNSIVAYASMPICIPTIPTMHNFDASNSFRCCYCTLHSMALSHSFSILSIVLFVWRWIDENIRQRKQFSICSQWKIIRWKYFELIENSIYLEKSSKIHEKSKKMVFIQIVLIWQFIKFNIFVNFDKNHQYGM